MGITPIPYCYRLLQTHHSNPKVCYNNGMRERKTTLSLPTNSMRLITMATATNVTTSIDTVVSQLLSKGYSVKSGDTEMYGGSTYYWFEKSYGSKRSDCSGGHIAVLRDGTYAFDLFNGGNNRGQHINSYSNNESVLSVDTLPVAEIIEFMF